VLDFVVVPGEPWPCCVVSNDSALTGTSGPERRAAQIAAGAASLALCSPGRGVEVLPSRCGSGAGTGSPRRLPPCSAADVCGAAPALAPVLLGDRSAVTAAVAPGSPTVSERVPSRSPPAAPRPL